MMASGEKLFNHHSQFSPCKSAIQEMQEAFEKGYDVSEKNRLEERIFDLVDAPKDSSFSFVSSGEEAIAQVIWSIFIEKSRKEGKTHFITSCIEDAPLLQMLKRCEDFGAVIKIAPVDQSGKIDLKALKELITPRTALISIASSHSLTGVVQPYEEIGLIAKEKEVLFHLDLSWSVGKIPYSFAESNADYITFGGEKIHGPQSGACFAKKDLPLISYVIGRGIDIPLLASLSAAARFAKFSLDQMGLEVTRLKALFEEKIMSEVQGTQVAFSDSERLPNTTTLIFPKVHHEALSWYLSRKNVFANASGSYSQHLHKVLHSSGIQTESALSFSLSRMTTEEEVVKGAEKIVETVRYLQTLTEDLFP